MKQSNDSLEQQLKKSSDEFRQAQDDNAALKGANAKLEAEYKELENRHSNTSKERDQANERISALQQQLELSKKQNK